MKGEWKVMVVLTVAAFVASATVFALSLWEFLT